MSAKLDGGYHEPSEHVLQDAYSVLANTILIYLSASSANILRATGVNYWLICLPRNDLEQCMRVGTFGLARKHVLGHVNNGDQIVCCAGKGDWKVIGLGKTISDYYMDDTKIFLKDGYFPDRIDIRTEKFAREKEIDLMSIIDQLSFVTKPAYWAVFFRNGIVKISKQDWDLIADQVTVVRSKG